MKIFLKINNNDEPTDEIIPCYDNE